MKKVIIFASILVLSGCLNAGEINILPQRNAMFENLSTYPIDFFDEKGYRLVKTEEVSDSFPIKGAAQQISNGSTVYYSKNYQRTYYQDCFVKAKKDGVLGSASVPSVISANQTKQLVGRANIDGHWYSLLPANLDGYVWLIQENGLIYDKMGKIKNNRLAVLQTDFVATPKDLSFEIITETKTSQTAPNSGIDIKYAGMKSGQLYFLSLDYSKYSTGSKEGFDEFIFEYSKDQIIEISGIKIRIISADDKKLNYIVL